MKLFSLRRSGMWRKPVRRTLIPLHGWLVVASFGVFHGIKTGVDQASLEPWDGHVGHTPTPSCFERRIEELPHVKEDVPMLC